MSAESDLAWHTTLWDTSHQQAQFTDYIGVLHGADHERLAEVAANTLLNSWCGDVADLGDSDSDPHGHGKRLPYIGWYWRQVDFARKRITVGDCGNFIGFMENNKWDHPERDLTPDEVDHVVALLWRARTEGGRGGLVSESWAARDAVLAELWEWMQSLEGLSRWDD